MMKKYKAGGDVSLSKSDKARLREYTKATGDNPSKTWSDGSYRNPMGDVRAWERESQAKMRPRNKPTPLTATPQALLDSVVDRIPKKKKMGGGRVKKNMGGKIRGYGLARGGRVCKSS